VPGDKAAGRQTAPVCDMTVRGDTSAAKVDFEGKTYYFCAEGCRKAFEADPQICPDEDDTESDAGEVCSEDILKSFGQSTIEKELQPPQP
jgi:YHS domain-containing protein